MLCLNVLIPLNYVRSIVCQPPLSSPLHCRKFLTTVISSSNLYTHIRNMGQTTKKSDNEDWPRYLTMFEHSSLCLHTLLCEVPLFLSYNLLLFFVLTTNQYFYYYL